RVLDPLPGHGDVGALWEPQNEPLHGAPSQDAHHPAVGVFEIDAVEVEAKPLRHQYFTLGQAPSSCALACFAPAPSFSISATFCCSAASTSPQLCFLAPSVSFVFWSTARSSA